MLSITLTARNKNAPNPIPMAGIPYHSLDKYTPLLLQAGHKVAIAEQIGEARPGVLVDREIVRVLTPGTIISDAV